MGEPLPPTDVNLVVMVGPSLYRTEVPVLPGELWLPPAQCGDIVRVVQEHHPKKLLLIDGVFAQSLAVWHKEIVFALLEGTVCFGSSSMGALRSAELWRYGMIPVGKIAQMYIEGEEDDSLVAMTFDPDTFRPIQEAPIGQEQKRRDAMEAIDFARAYSQPVNTTLTREAIGPFVNFVLERILDDTPTG